MSLFNNFIPVILQKKLGLYDFSFHAWPVDYHWDESKAEYVLNLNLSYNHVQKSLREVNKIYFYTVMLCWLKFKTLLNEWWLDPLAKLFWLTQELHVCMYQLVFMYQNNIGLWSSGEAATLICCLVCNKNIDKLSHQFFLGL